MAILLLLYVLLVQADLTSGLCTYSTVDGLCRIDVGTIVGIVIGAVVALVIVAFVIILACSHVRMVYGEFDTVPEVVTHNSSDTSGQALSRSSSTNESNIQISPRVISNNSMRL